MSLLAKTLGLELEDTEVPVGRYKADIMAAQPGVHGKVVIENQLEETNHEYLGKTLTYAAILGTATVIWVTQKLTEEHRQAID